MYDIPNLSEWVYTIQAPSTGDLVKGDPGGVATLALEQLAKRTNWLKDNMGGGGSVTEVDDDAPVNSNTLVWSINKINNTFARQATQWSIKTTNYTASIGDCIFANTSSSAWTLTLPVAPVIGNRVCVIDYSDTWDSNNLTINGNGQRIKGLNENLICDIKGCSVTLIYSDSTRGWIVT